MFVRVWIPAAAKRKLPSNALVSSMAATLVLLQTVLQQSGSTARVAHQCRRAIAERITSHFAHDGFRRTSCRQVSNLVT